MNYLNCEWLGFAATPEDAIRIIQDTGIFYSAIALSYLLSFLYMIWHSPTTKDKKRTHCFGIVMWAVFGECILLQPYIFATFFNGLIILLALLVLYQLQFTSALMAQTTLTSPKESTENKKEMYANTLLTKMNYKLSDVLGFTLINEQILWLLILYRAIITFRASLGL